MVTILINFFVFKIIYLAILITAYYNYKKKRVPLLIVSIISFLTLAALINDFYAPSLNSNIRVYKKIENLKESDIENINLIKDNIKKTITSEEQFKLFAEHLKNTEADRINHPRIIQEFELFLNLKNEGETIKIIIIELEADKSIIELMNNFNNRYYQIGRFENPRIHQWIKNVLNN